MRSLAALVLAVVLTISGAVSGANAATTGSITGHVSLGTSALSAGAGEVRVVAHPYLEPSASVLTDASGNYSFEGLALGYYDLEFQYLGSGSFVDIWWQNAPVEQLADAFLVKAGSGVADAVLPASASISGYVTIDGTTPMAHTEVVIRTSIFIYQAEDQPPVSVKVEEQAFTDATGFYSFPRLRAGDYSARFYHSGFAPARTYDQMWGGSIANPQGEDVVLKPGQVRDDIDLDFTNFAKLVAVGTCPGCGTAPFATATTNFRLEALNPVTHNWSQAGDGWIGAGLPAPSGAFYITYPGTYRVYGEYDASFGWGRGWSEEITIPQADQTVQIGMVKPTVQRIAGANRFDVAASISASAFDPGVDVVYVANGLNFPDALSAGPAAAHQGGPLLLVTPTSVPDPIRAELLRLDPHQIVVVGGVNSVSPAVYAELAGLADKIRRINGADRFEVSQKIATYAFGATGARTAFFATGLKFPDALSSGGAAAKLDAPVITVNGVASAIDGPTRSVISNLGLTHALVAGGPLSVTDDIFYDLQNLPLATERLSGETRYDASYNINARAFDNAGTVILAVGTNYPDALAGGPLAAALGGPLFVIPRECIPPAVLEFIKSPATTNVIILGGYNSVASRVKSLPECP